MAATIGMENVYAIAANAVSSLGLNTAAHWQAVSTGRTGIRQHTDEAFSPQPFFGSRLHPSLWQAIQQQTPSKQVLSPFEQMCIFTAKQAFQNLERDIDLSQTVLILSTTKGNIEWLNQVPYDRVMLHRSAHIIASELGIKTKPIVISHACVSGVVSLVHASRLLQAGKYKNAIVIGCDRFSKFVLNGFQSFHAIAPALCRPFDAARKGINLGEAAAAIILTTENGDDTIGLITGGASSNDANHISGPSRTGEELSMAINIAIKEAGITAPQIDMLSAHGTATIYNDEMESKAFALSHLSATPLHSMKGYIGHTLGAAGVIESVMILESIRRQQLIPSLGFETLGVPMPVNVTTIMQPARIQHVLKTASGFGGSNAAMVWKAAN